MPYACRIQFTYFFDNANTVIRQSPLIGLCHSSITTVATLFIFLLVTLLLKLFSSVDTSKAFCHTLCQYYKLALQAGCVNGPATVCCCQLEIKWEQTASTHNTFKWFYQCKNLKQTAMCATWSLISLPFAISHAPCQLQTFLPAFWF